MRLAASVLLVSASVPSSGLEQRHLRSDAGRSGFLRQSPDDADQREIAALKAQVASLRLEQAEWRAGPDGKEEKKLTEQHSEDEKQMKTLREELAHEEDALASTQKDLEERTVELDVRDTEVKSLEAEVTNLTAHGKSAEKSAEKSAPSKATPSNASSSVAEPVVETNSSRNASSEFVEAFTAALSANASTAVFATSEANTTNATVADTSSVDSTELPKAPAPDNTSALVAEVAALQAEASQARVDAAIEREKNHNLRTMQKTLWDKTSKMFSKVNTTLRRTMRQLSEEKVRNKQIQQEGLSYFNENKQLMEDKKRLQKVADTLRADKSQMILTMHGVLTQNTQYEKEVADDKEEMKAQAQDFAKKEKEYKAEIARYAAKTPIRDIVNDYQSRKLDGEHARMMKTLSKSSPPSTTLAARKLMSEAQAERTVAAKTTSAPSEVTSAPKEAASRPQAAAKEVREQADDDDEDEPVGDMEELSDLSKLEVGIDRAKRDLELEA